ncbi:MAG: hypothetical protein ACK5OX_10825, partial [Desertimonas sp.]
MPTSMVSRECRGAATTTLFKKVDANSCETKGVVLASLLTAPGGAGGRRIRAMNSIRSAVAAGKCVPRVLIAWLVLAAAAQVLVLAPSSAADAYQSQTVFTPSTATPWFQGPVAASNPAGFELWRATVTSGTTAAGVPTLALSDSVGATNSVIGATGYSTNYFEPDQPTGTPAVRPFVQASGCYPPDAAVPPTTDCPRGTLTISFPRPVTNPVVHVAGMGGGNTEGTSTFAMRYTLATGSPYTLTLLSSGTDIAVTSNSIYNSATGGGTCQSVPGDPNPERGACGSVRVNGTMSQLVFNIGLDTAGTAPYATGSDGTLMNVT